MTPATSSPRIEPDGLNAFEVLRVVQCRSSCTVRGLPWKTCTACNGMIARATRGELIAMSAAIAHRVRWS